MQEHALQLLRFDRARESHTDKRVCPWHQSSSRMPGHPQTILSEVTMQEAIGLYPLTTKLTSLPPRLATTKLFTTCLPAKAAMIRSSV